METNNNRFNESFAKACKNLMLSQPFYGIFLMMVNKKTSSDIPTLCVSLKGIVYDLLINPEFWDSLDTPVQQGALQHECLHLINFHLTSFTHLPDKELLNIAMDLEINQYIPLENRGEGWMYLSRFAHLNLEEKKGTLYYYEKLQQASQAGDQLVNQIINAMRNRETVIVVPGQGNMQVPYHDWQIENTFDDGGRRILEAQIGKIIKEAADQVVKSRGTVPSEISEILERLTHIEPPRFDWKGCIRRFIGCSTKVYVKKTRRKINVRFEENPGQKVKPHKHVLLALDTSGSVSTKELREFQEEMYHIYRNGTEITVIQCDAAISSIKSFNPKEDFAVHGRGGTSFQPVIDYYSVNLTKYSCLIYMTDGEAPDPHGVVGQVLWVLSSTSTKTNHLTGKTIQLNG